MNKIFFAIGALVSVIVTVAGISLLLAFPIKWSWNYAVVSTFGLPAITWGKAWCLSFLGSIFFKNTASTSKS